MHNKIIMGLLTLGCACGSAIAQEDEHTFTFGGHLRANFDHRDWVNSEDRSRFEFESLKLTVNGQSGKFSYKADYRWYENADMDVVRYADATYTFNENQKLTGGITKVPFGLLPFASNSFWFSLNYYLGLEDDYDAGFVYEHNQSDWQFHLGYFFNDEYNKPAQFGRYSFDVADDGDLRYKENGQFNFRVNKTFTSTSNVTTDVGFSYQYADILNLDTSEETEHTAWAVHLRSQYDKLKLELEYLSYEYDLTSANGGVGDRIILSAFNYPFPIASEGESFTANLVYSVPYENKQIKNISCYSEYGVTDSDLATASKSVQWVNGCSFSLNKLFIYVDSIQGKNMWFSGGSGVGLDFPDADESTHRLNINFGYYF